MNVTEQQNLWDSFLKRWPLEKLKEITLDQYVSVDDQDTFTYWLETKTRPLGSIQGNTSAKFGIYKRGGEGKIQSGIGHGDTYSWRTKYGDNEEMVFEYVKQSLLKIVDAVGIGDLNAIEQVDFSGMVKWKVAFLYQNQASPCLLNIFSKPMLEILLDEKASVTFPELYPQLLAQRGDEALLAYGTNCWKKAEQKKEQIKQKQIFSKFSHVKIFTKHIVSWSDDLKQSFCKLIEVANTNKLDVFTTKMTSGGMIRIGRKEIGVDSALTVFATFNPTSGTIFYKQRFKHPKEQDCLKADISKALVEQIIKSKDLAEFNNEFPITRKPYWPDAFDNDVVNENTNEPYKTEKSEGNEMNTIAPLNQILYGPPGTGKTYHTIEAAVKAAEPQYFIYLEAHILDIDERRKALKNKYDELVKSDRIRFVTFHQSYGYEEFVEGLKARETECGDINYVTESGVFKKICEDATFVGLEDNSGIKSDGRVWKISIEGAHKNASKTYCLANNIVAIGWGNTGDLSTGNKNDYFLYQGKNNQNSLTYFAEEMNEGDLVLCINSNTSIEAVGVITSDYSYIETGLASRSDYCHQRNVKWLKQGISVGFKELNGNKQFSLPTCYPLDRLSVADVLTHLSDNDVVICRDKVATNKEKYVLVIDEINRGNISKIFGELITLIEPSKRSGLDPNGNENDEALSIILPNSPSKKFSVPSNLHIIGTMNTADRSLAMMDTALRRRFDFKEMMPKPELFADCSVNGINLTRLLDTMNKRIEVLYDREHTLGHAFLFPAYNAQKSDNEELAFKELQSAFQNKIIPLLEEYFYEDWGKIRLVLGDNQKEEQESLPFVRKTKIEYNDLFGEAYQADEYGQPQNSYQLATFDDGVWSNAKAYIAIYEPKSSN